MQAIKSVYDLKKNIRLKIDSGDLNGALKSIHLAVEQIFCEPLNSTKIFGSQLFDDFCQEIGGINLKKRQNNKSGNQVPGRTVVYVATKLQASGGHTAVLADIIRLSPANKIHVLVTGLDGISDRAAILQRFAEIDGITFEYAPRGSHIKKLDWLQSRIQELNPKDVWLFNHHHDSVAVAAVQRTQDYNLHFYHHGDHHFSLGVYLEGIDHIDPHPMGFHNCRQNLGICDNRYMPLTVKDLGVSKQKVAVDDKDRRLLTCTAARSNKVEVEYFVKYVDVIPEMLKASKGSHVHIGKLSYFALRKIRKKIRALGLDADCFKYVPYVPSIWGFFLENNVDLYIASFPYGGGRTLIEAMGAGVPVAAHSHCISRLLGGFDMLSERDFVWRNPEELYDYVAKVNFRDLESQGAIARENYLKYHTDSVLAECLKNGSKLIVPDLRSDYFPDALQQSFNVTNEFGFLRIAKLYIYKKYRWWRSCFS